MTIANKPLAIVTGASSGIGLHATRALIDKGWYVIMACRDLEKAQQAARSLDLPDHGFEIAHLDLGSLDSVRTFHTAFHAKDQALDALVCNAATYLRNRKGHALTGRP